MEKTDLELLDDFLLKVANTKAGIRRKIVSIERFINAMKKKSKKRL